MSDIFLTSVISCINGVIVGIITIIGGYFFAKKSKLFDTTLETKKQAFLTALDILDAQTSHCYKGSVLQTKRMSDIRSAFSKLIVFSDNPEIPKKFASFFLPENTKKIKILNEIRNLIRTELGLKEASLDEEPYDRISFLAYVDCAEEEDPTKNLTK